MMDIRQGDGYRSNDAYAVIDELLDNAFDLGESGVAIACNADAVIVLLRAINADRDRYSVVE